MTYHIDRHLLSPGRLIRHVRLEEELESDGTGQGGPAGESGEIRGGIGSRIDAVAHDSAGEHTSDLDVRLIVGFTRGTEDVDDGEGMEGSVQVDGVRVIGSSMGAVRPVVEGRVAADQVVWEAGQDPECRRRGGFRRKYNTYH